MSQLEIDLFREVQALSLHPASVQDALAGLSHILRRDFDVE